MAENAFVAALLKMAAEERLKAFTARTMLQPPSPGLSDVPWYLDLCARLDRHFENTAQEAEGRAEVYERFAHRIIGDAVRDLILAEFEHLAGTAELLEVEPPFKLDYLYRLYQPPFPSSLDIFRRPLT